MVIFPSSVYGHHDKKAVVPLAKSREKNNSSKLMIYQHSLASMLASSRSVQYPQATFIPGVPIPVLIFLYILPKLSLFFRWEIGAK